MKSVKKTWKISKEFINKFTDTIDNEGGADKRI